MIPYILGAEASFWVLLLAALFTRYLLRLRRTSTALLCGLPLVDLALLSFVTIDLARGSEPTQSHALAASYLGFTLAFGHPMVRWSDRWFAYRFSGAARPLKPIKGSGSYVRGLWVEWLRVAFGAVVAAGILTALALVVCGESVPSTLDDAAHSPFWAQIVTLGMVTVIWFLAGPAFARQAADRA